MCRFSKMEKRTKSLMYSTVYNATATSTVLYVADDMNELLLLVLLYADVMWLIRVYYTLLVKFWLISLYLTEDVIAKHYVT